MDIFECSSEMGDSMGVLHHLVAFLTLCQLARRAQREQENLMRAAVVILSKIVFDAGVGHAIVCRAQFGGNRLRSHLALWKFYYYAYTLQVASCFHFPSVQIVALHQVSGNPRKYLKVTVQRVKSALPNREVGVPYDLDTKTRSNLDQDLAALAEPTGLLNQNHLKHAKRLGRLNDCQKFATFCIIHKRAPHCVLLSDYFAPEGCDAVIYDSSLVEYTEEDWEEVFQKFPSKTTLHLAFVDMQQQMVDGNCGPFMLIAYFAITCEIPPENLLVDEWNLRPSLIKVFLETSSVQTLIIKHFPQLRERVIANLLRVLSPTQLCKIGFDVDYSRVITRRWLPVRKIQKSFQRSVLVSQDSGKIDSLKYGLKNWRRRRSKATRNRSHCVMLSTQRWRDGRSRTLEQRRDIFSENGHASVVSPSRMNLKRKLDDKRIVVPEDFLPLTTNDDRRKLGMRKRMSFVEKQRRISRARLRKDRV